MQKKERMFWIRHFIFVELIIVGYGNNMGKIVTDLIGFSEFHFHHRKTVLREHGIVFFFMLKLHETRLSNF
jgi:hypothetical protein